MSLTRAVLQGSLCKLSPWRKQPVHPIRDQGTPFIRFLYHRAPALRNAGFWALLGFTETVVTVFAGETGRMQMLINTYYKREIDHRQRCRFKAEDPTTSQADRTGFLVDSADGKA